MERDVEAGWFAEEHWPRFSRLVNRPWTWPQTLRTESGLLAEVDLDRTGARCEERHVERHWRCAMPVGHDTLHMPLHELIERREGPLMVVRLSTEV